MSGGQKGPVVPFSQDATTHTSNQVPEYAYWLDFNYNIIVVQICYMSQKSTIAKDVLACPSVIPAPSDHRSSPTLGATRT